MSFICELTNPEMADCILGVRDTKKHVDDELAEVSLFRQISPMPLKLADPPHYAVKGPSNLVGSVSTYFKE